MHYDKRNININVFFVVVVIQWVLLNSFLYQGNNTIYTIKKTLIELIKSLKWSLIKNIDLMINKE